MKTSYTITFLPYGEKAEVSKEATILDAGEEFDYFLEATCGGKGTCGKCKIQLLEDDGRLDPSELQLLAPEELADKIRLACRRRVDADLQVKVWEAEIESSAKIKAFGEERAIPVEFNEGDNQSHRNYGVAIDIGTTTIAAYLVDLKSGETISAAATTNSQRRWGGDVMSRIQYAMSDPEGLGVLQKRVIQNINGLILRLVKENGILVEMIDKLSLVGNSAMYHLFFGIDPSSLGVAPYMPLRSSSFHFRPVELGFELSEHVKAHFLPCIAGFVGADIVGVILASDILDRNQMSLALDLGTNGETVLGDKHGIVCGSNAAGPAFEGARIRQGMRAVPGAISDFKIDLDSDPDSTVQITTVLDIPPKGICGSGLIAIVSELLSAGIIDSTGRLLDPRELDSKLPENLKGRIEINQRRGNNFVLAREGYRGRPVRITQQDVREIQLATAAIAAGREVLLSELGIGTDDIDEVLLAGAFGNYIQPKHAMRIGLIPKVPLEKVKFIGNAAGRGAKYALISKSYAQKAEEIKASAKFIEFAGRVDFQDLFIEKMIFPE